MEVKSPIFRGKVVAAAKKYLWKIDCSDGWPWTDEEMLQAVKAFIKFPDIPKALLVVDAKAKASLSWTFKSRNVYQSLTEVVAGMVQEGRRMKNGMNSRLRLDSMQANLHDEKLL